MHKLGAILFFIPFFIFAQTAEPEKLSLDQQLIKASKELKLSAARSGKISLPNGIEVDLPEGYVFYDGKSANSILTSWGNPPSSTTGSTPLLGLIFGSKNGLVDPDSKITITVEANTLGYISDDAADDYDYAEILESLQKSTLDGNAARKEQGYPKIELKGWADTPFYDKATHKIYFAKELIFDDSPDHSLNYEIDVLGRHGYVKLTFLGGIEDLALIKKEREKVLDAVNYVAGKTYTDFVDGDKEAEGDVASLITGSNLVVAGGILALLLRFKKLLIFGFIGIVAFFGKLFGGRQEA